MEKWNDGYVVLFKRFDNETGAELSPEYNYVTVEELQKVRQELHNQQWAVTAILGDIEKLG